ncbi:MAG: Trp family transcriptional regulator, partial [Patescibacteria group bacterium]
ALLTDLLTPKELGSLAKRWELLKELARGTQQRVVAKKLKLSISKITRGSRVLRHGTGAAWMFLKRMGVLKG